MTNFEYAELIGKSKTKLRKRLNESKTCLKSKYLQKFKNPTFDFENKRLYGNDGYYLQWNNDGITNVGSVYLEKAEEK